MSELEDFYDEILIDDRVCPMPIYWNKLWKMLPDRKRVDGQWEPQLPLILSAWNYSEDEAKLDVFKKHIKWAYEHNAFERIQSFLKSLNEDQWHKLQ